MKESLRNTQRRAEFIRKAKEKHGDRYDYSRLVFLQDAKVTITCREHGEFIQTTTNHVRNGSGCPKCWSKRRTQAKVSRESFIEKAMEVHDDRYDYSRVAFEKMHTPVKIICSDHGEFHQKPILHVKGQGCPQCAPNRKLTTSSFIEKAKTIHGDRYGYDSLVYINQKHPVRITCPDHGPFEQNPNDHLLGSGCSKCSYEKRAVGRLLSLESFIAQAQVVHENRYDYTKAVYRGMDRKLDIICSKHGVFRQTPGNHLSDHGCPRCGKSISQPEIDLKEFLESLGASVIHRDRSILKGKELDLYLPDHRLALEYCGLRWHSEEFGRTKNAHLNKHLSCEQEGIRLITIFEDEWLERPDQIKATLRHFLGRSKPGVYARKVKIKEITWSEAKPFLARHHLLGSGTSGRYRIGAYYGDQLIGVMTFGSPSDERGRNDIVEMKRFVSDGRNHPGLGSKMFKWAIREYKFDHVMAFVDRRWFTGSFKSISGFVQTGQSLPTLFWTKQNKRYHRRFMTKKKAIKQGILNPGETKLQLMNRLGYQRIWDCGKIKLEWINPEASFRASD